MSSTDKQGSSLGSFPTSPPLYPHFNRPSGFWPCVKSCLVGGSDKYLVQGFGIFRLTSFWRQNWEQLFLEFMTHVGLFSVFRFGDTCGLRTVPVLCWLFFRKHLCFSFHWRSDDEHEFISQRRIFLRIEEIRFNQFYLFLLNVFIWLPRKPKYDTKVGLIIFTNPSARAEYDRRSIFKRSLTGLNSEFSFS